MLYTVGTLEVPAGRGVRALPRRPTLDLRATTREYVSSTERVSIWVVDTKAVVLVEGVSDRVALQTLAARRGRDLDAEGVAIVPIGGAQALGRFLERASGVRIAGLCDAGEERSYTRALERAGVGSNLSRKDMESSGFFICDADLEDELIRALGAERVEEIVAAHGDIRRFRTLQKQPDWRGRPAHEQLRRFMGSGGRRKLRYARFLVEALDLEAVPRPLDGVLAHV